MSKLILTLGLGLASLIGAASARGGQDRDCGLRCGNTPVFAQAEEEVYVVYVAGHDGHGGLLPYAEYCHGSYAFCKVIASGFIRDGQGAMIVRR